MSEISYYWNPSIGDAIGNSPYSADLWAVNDAIMLAGSVANAGIIRGYKNGLVVAGIGNSAVSVETGAALINGGFYLNTTKKTITLLIPSADTREDKIVLRKDWATGTIRIAVRSGIQQAGGGAQALVQINLVEWEIPLATVTVNPDGSLTGLTSLIEFAVSPFSGIGQGMQLLETKEITSATNSVTFTLPSGSWKNFKITGQMRSSLTGGNEEALGVYFNADTTASNYVAMSMNKLITVAAPPVGLGVNNVAPTLQIVSADIGDGYVTKFEIDFFNTETTNEFTSMLMNAEHFIGDTSLQASVYLQRKIATWRNTAKVTSVLLKLASDDIIVGSSLSLWGFKT